MYLEISIHMKAKKLSNILLSVGLGASVLLSYHCGEHIDCGLIFIRNDVSCETSIRASHETNLEPDYWKYFITPRNFSTYLLKNIPFRLNMFHRLKKDRYWMESNFNAAETFNYLSYYDNGVLINSQVILNYSLSRRPKNWLYYSRPLNVPTNIYYRPATLNKYDGENRKTGVWVESDHTNDFDCYMSISYYYKGQKNGLSQTYRSNRLASIAYYRQDKLQAPYVVFNNNQMVSYIMTKIKPVEEFKDRVPEWMSQDSDDSTINQGYFIELSPEGRIIQEGWRIFPGNFDGIKYLNVGNHTIYDSDSTSYTKSY